MICVCEPENVTGVGGRHALDIAQDDDFTLGGRQCVDRVEDDLAGLAGEQFIFRRAPGGGLESPMVGPPGMTRGQKPGLSHGRLCRRRKRDFAAFGAGPRTREVDDDAEDPGAEGGPPLVTIE